MPFYPSSICFDFKKQQQRNKKKPLRPPKKCPFSFTPSFIHQWAFFVLFISHSHSLFLCRVNSFPVFLSHSFSTFTFSLSYSPFLPIKTLSFVFLFFGEAMNETYVMLRVLVGSPLLASAIIVVASNTFSCNVAVQVYAANNDDV